jgi:hypothetical protein
MSERTIIADSVGVGFSVQGQRVSVHYPKRLPDGSMAFGAGFEVDYPFGQPSNPITDERTSLVDRLLRMGEP